MGDDVLMRGWEYRTITASQISELAQLGQEGWEFAGTLPSGQEPPLILKRRGLDFRERVTLQQRAAYYRARGLAVPSEEGEARQ